MAGSWRRPPRRAAPCIDWAHPNPRVTPCVKFRLASDQKYEFLLARKLAALAPGLSMADQTELYRTTWETLAVLAGMKSLESLQLSEARLSREALGQLKQLPELKKLILEGIDLTEAEADALRQDLPKVEIKWTKPSDVYLKRINALFGTR